MIDHVNINGLFFKLPKYRRPIKWPHEKNKRAKAKHYPVPDTHFLTVYFCYESLSLRF